MTYVIDLQNLWSCNTQNTAASFIPSLESQYVVSVIIVITCNEEKRLLATIESIIMQKFIREVIMVNTCAASSMEETLEKFVKLYPRCCIVKAQTKKLAEAYNIGAQHACGQFLLFLDALCILPKNAVLKLLSTGYRKPSPWIVGIRSHEKVNNKIFSKMTNFYEVKDNNCHSLPEVSLIGGGVHAFHVARECLFISAAAFFELKGMDKKCSNDALHFDLCLRVHLAGGGVYSVEKLDLDVQPSLPKPLPALFSQEWAVLRTGYHLYHKHVSKKKNLISMTCCFGLLGFQSLKTLYHNAFASFRRPPKPMLAKSKPV